ncbi:hypothetical protein G5B38_03020 [Pseudohalocynthiibacter aestuariivivens]|nr:hypothetical protein [Pseudohalocynthiibacter aestuariivivens]QIE44583.1 hypothetical protein G5B38_03020 [Pseudohalocynthiibacter aestuariivivens]
MPNTIAYLMLMFWPVVCAILFRRLTPERAIIWSILGGYLLLPQSAEFDLPLVPDMNKTSIPNICAFVLCVFYLKKRISLWPQNWAMRLLLVGFVIGVVPTVLTNGDAMIFTLLGDTAPIVFSTASLPGLGLRDLLSVVINQIIVVLPFLLARSYLSTETGLRELLYALVVAALFYSIPALIEIRLSPQMNVWVYGFFQHSFEQMMRDGGFRPLVFLPHALWLAFFVMSAAMAALALGRQSSGSERVRFFAFAVYLLVLLVLCKSLASMIYALLLGALLLVTSARMQIRVALIFALVAVIYPMLRDQGMIPIDAILRQAEAFNPDRAQSLGYRFSNEEALLERAHEKWLFGWGGWGRNLVHDMQTGQIISIPDGEWIIVFGTFGWVGYVCQMGLLGGPLIVLWAGLRNTGPHDVPPYVAPLALLLAITLIDMLLNAILTPYTWMMAGAILGCCERLSSGHSLGASVGQSARRTVMGRPAERRRTSF